MSKSRVYFGRIEPARRDWRNEKCRNGHKHDDHKHCKH